MQGGGWVHVRPIGLASATTWRNIADVTNFLYETPSVKLFVEIGANYCGWSALMVARTLIFPDFGYLGIEKEKDRSNANLERFMAGKPRCSVIWDDCFAPHVLEQVKEWIDATPGQAVVWCDGTNKSKEIEAYHPLLRANDFLMMHDYHHEVKSDGNPSWKDCKPLVESGQFVVAVPDYWAIAAGMFMLRKVK